MGLLSGILAIFAMVTLAASSSSPDSLHFTIQGAVVETPLGKLLGSLMESRGGRSYSAFEGIPYAQPPKRFKAAQPVEPWEGVKDATRRGINCPQGNMFVPKEVTGNEDCLFLNIYSPNVTGSYPVMIYIHGGAFMYGSADIYGGKYYMDEDVVVVTLNYRLGALGFLNTGDDVIPGNFGLKDQNLALRWVQDNIEYFGGDKNQVTIFGVSAGAASVSYHILSPQSKGMFQRAIMQSGSALNPWAYRKYPKQAAEELAIELECPYEDSKQFLECLEGKSAEEITKAQALIKWHFDPISPFGPSVEVESEGAFLTECPRKLLQEGRFTKVPLLSTIVKDEGQFLHAAVIVHRDNLLQELNEEWDRIAPITFHYDDIDFSSDSQNSLSSDIREFYFEDMEVDKATQQELADLYSDRWFIHGIQDSILLHAKHSPVHAGLFAFKGVPSLLTLFGIKDVDDMISHGDDIKFHADIISMMQVTISPEQEQASKQIVKLWVDFASGSEELELNGVAWKQVSKDEIENKSVEWFELNENPVYLKGKFDARMRFWDEVLKKYKNAVTFSKTEL